MAKKPRKLVKNVTREELDDFYSHMALKRMRDHRDGLPAAMVYCGALGLALPEWARDALAAQQLSTTVSGGRRRQRKTQYQMETFTKDLLRYEFVCLCEGERREKRTTKMGFAFEQVEDLWFAPKDSSGLEKSYYKFQRMFGSRRLSRFVADRVTAAWMNRETTP